MESVDQSLCGLSRVVSLIYDREASITQDFEKVSYVTILNWNHCKTWLRKQATLPVIFLIFILSTFRAYSTQLWQKLGCEANVLWLSSARFLFQNPK